MQTSPVERITSATGRISRALAATMLLTAVATSVVSERASATTPPGAAAFVPVAPSRLFDSRTAGDPLAASATVTIPVHGVGDVPPTATAVAVTVTATETAGPGFVTVWGDGEQPTVSALNIDAAGQTRSNFAVVPVAADGTLHLFVSVSSHVVVDVTGAFLATTDPVRAGRFVPVVQRRVLDTRLTNIPFAPFERRGVRLTGYSVPVDATAAVVAISGAGTESFWSAYAADSDWPGTVAVTVPAGGAPATATAIVPLHDGRLTLMANAGGHVILDIVGYFTGPSSPLSAAGLFVPVDPRRVLDTRDGDGSGRVQSGDAVAAADFPFPLVGVAGVTANVTVVSPWTPGFLTVFPAGTNRPFVASANVTAGQVLANGLIAPTTAGGVGMYASMATDLVVDVSGYFTADPSSPPLRSIPETTTGAGVPAIPLGLPLPVPAQPAPGPFTFASVDDGGQHAQFDPCRTIEVRVNLAGAPAGLFEEVVHAVDELRAATGLDLVVVGETSDRTVIGAWHAPKILVTMEPLAPSLAGLAENTMTWVSGSFRTVSSKVMLSSAIKWNPTGVASIVRHELGHSVGLGHAPNPSQVMATPTGSRSYRNGDLYGLYHVGSSSGCAGVRAASAFSIAGVATTTLTIE